MVVAGLRLNFFWAAYFFGVVVIPVGLTITRRLNTMQSVVAGHAPITLKSNKYLG